MGKRETKGSSRRTKKDITRQIQALFDSDPQGAYEMRTIFDKLKLRTHPTKILCSDILRDMVLDDFLTVKDGAYRLNRNNQVMEGVFQRKRNGRNSVIPDDGDKSILVTERNSGYALDGDRVRFTMLARRRDHTREAQVTEILERRPHTFVGRLEVSRNYAFLSTEDRTLANDIFIPKNSLKGGRQGDKALVEITQWDDSCKNPIGRVIDVLGPAGDNNAEMHSILAEYGLPYDYPKAVEEAAEKISDVIPQSEVDRREDFRTVTTFTIDPRDAKDFDDALSIRKLKDGVWEVGVHIADVTHYVHEGDIIDREAVKRATSVYLVDRTIPMLPERLCNYICSLRPDEDKLAYSTIFEMNDKGAVLKWHLAHTVIRSNHRFVYEEVQEILEQNGEASAEDLMQPGHHPERVSPSPDGKPVGLYAEELIVLNRLAKCLRAQRFKNGAVDFDRPEVRFEIDEKGHPVSTYVKLAKDANKLVEEFMLLANKSVAEMIGKVPHGKKAKVLPYRIHDVPDPEKLEHLSEFIQKFGYKVRTDGGKTEISKSLNRLLEDVKGKKEQELIEIVALRAMQKARYSIHNIGHYGLMFPYYTHFTSPIRRYPDDMVHRLLTRYAEGGRSASGEKYESLCEHSSAMEQLAETAERASIKYKQVEFMADRMGQEFQGTISGITEFGIYVELDENHCEGMVPLRDLQGDYYEFDERNYCLWGRRYHKRYSLGDSVRVRVARANLERRQLDFELIEEGKNSETPSHPESHQHNKKTGATLKDKKRGKRRK